MTRNIQQEIAILKDAGLSKEDISAMLASNLESNEKILDVGHICAQGWEFMNRVTVGYHLPFSSLKNDLMLVKGELSLLSGYTGQGKSEFSTQVALNCINQGARVLIVSLEMSPAQTHARLFQQATGQHNPTYDYYHAFSKHYCKKIYLYNKMGSEKIEKILEVATPLVEYGNIDFLIIDNLMMLDDKTDDYNRQLATVQILSAFAKSVGIAVLLVAHSKKPQATGFSRDYIPPGVYDVLGASSIVNLVDNHFSITINHKKIRVQEKLKKYGSEFLEKDEHETLKQGDSFLKRDKKREHGTYFMKDLYYDKNFRSLKDFEGQRIKPLFDFNPSVKVPQSIENEFDEASLF